MTPNPNPSPELRELIDMLDAATLEEGVRVYEHDAEEIGLATMNARADLLAALSPQTLPAPGEVERLERRAIQIVTEERGAEWAVPKIIRAMMRFRAEALATVAAANDEAFARGVEAAAKVADELCADMTAEADAEPGVITKLLHRASAQTAEKIAAAIRLLSQGEPS